MVLPDTTNNTNDDETDAATTKNNNDEESRNDEHIEVWWYDGPSDSDELVGKGAAVEGKGKGKDK